MKRLNSFFVSLSLGMAAFYLSPVMAQPPEVHVHDHGNPDVPAAPAAPPAPQDHVHDSLGSPVVQAEPMDHSAHMAAPADPDSMSLRDPHAYSGGFTLNSAPYGMDGDHTSHMADTMKFTLLKLDRLEWTDDERLLDGELTYGNSFDKLKIKLDHSESDSAAAQGHGELLWSHAVSPFWDTRLGVRSDFGQIVDREWLAVGFQGLAPYWIHVDATAYLADGGHSDFRLKAVYDMLFSQRAILEPRLELGFRGRADRQNGLDQGFTSATAGLRLRYEFSRQFAPYVGVEWTEYLSGTRDLLPDARRSDTRWVAGLRFWF